MGSGLVSTATVSPTPLPTRSPDVDRWCYSPRPSEFHRWALTFPTYEILNTHGSSSFGTGIVVAVIVGRAVGATKGGSAASETSLCALTHPEL